MITIFIMQLCCNLAKDLFHVKRTFNEEGNRLLLIHTTNNAHPSSGASTARRWLPAVAQTEFMPQASPALKLGGKMKRLFHHLRENTS